MVTDAISARPIAGATVFHAGRTAVADSRGKFEWKGSSLNTPIGATAVGYRSSRFLLTNQGKVTIRLQPIRPRGFYLSFKALGNDSARARVLRWLDGDGLNVLVVDIKDEHGRMTFYNAAPEAGQMGAFNAVKFNDMPAFLREMHARNIYVVGRISVFRDALLAKHRTDWSPTAKGPGNIFWLDPFRQEVWGYNIAVAREAAIAGFDEIQFDNVRFPTEQEFHQATYSRRDSEGNRLKALTEFLTEAKEAIKPYGASLSLGPERYSIADQSADGFPARAKQLETKVEYICLREVDGLTLKAATQAIGGDPIRFRSWMILPTKNGAEGQKDQIFKSRIGEIDAAGRGGWILQDPADQYDLEQDFVREL